MRITAMFSRQDTHFSFLYTSKRTKARNKQTQISHINTVSDTHKRLQVHILRSITKKYVFWHFQVKGTYDLNISRQLSIKFLQAHLQLRKRGPLLRAHRPTISHHRKSKTIFFKFQPINKTNFLQFIRTINRLRQAVAIFEVGGHLKRIYLQIGLLR